jgi:SAM-dependent methyltransferase
MQSLLYGELVPWYFLLDPPKDHAVEAAAYESALEGAASPRPETLLELGAGAGNNALYLKKSFRCTLTDLSPPMLALSQRQNPECEHVVGDMRTLRLGRTFDVVFVHDSIMYMTSEAELAAVAKTAFEHTRPGGGALFAPDYVRETFRERTELHQNDEDEGDRSLRCLDWTWDPDPTDDTFVTEYALLLRERGSMRAVHDRHVEGLFSRATWRRILEGAGFRVESVRRPFDDEMTDEMFVCRKR